LLLTALGMPAAAQSTGSGSRSAAREFLPIPDPPFKGKIGKTYKESQEAWPELPSPPAGAPNVIVILLDDVGFGQTSTFGGSIPTPQIDRLAAQGIKYNRFHTTAICSPTRAALITGRNHHNAGFGFLVEWSTGFPSYNSMIPKSTATIGTILRENGYSTSWFGKNHNTPDWETSVAGPFDRWPTHLGFDYFYGFHAGETHQYYPVLFENTTPVEPSKSPEEGYHFMTDMTEKAIDWLRYNKSIAPQKPVFLYFAPGAMHAPHHVTKEWRDKFKGKFDHGWDKERDIVLKRQIEMGIVPPDTRLAPRIQDVALWDKLPEPERRFYARLMENYAGYFAFTDYEVGRLLDAVWKLPDADNTLIFYIVGDNGASSEGGMQGTVNEVKSLSGFQTPLEENLAKIEHIGGPETEPHYPVGWAMAGNAPFPWVKQVASHFGGTRNPMVVVWPKRIQPDSKPRSQFLHVIDIVPTILEAAGLPAPKVVNGVEQKPMDGVSFFSTFTDAAAPEVRTRQYFEVFSNRGIYDNGWYACTQHTLPWRQDYAPGNWENDKWELYNLNEDFSLANDLAAKHPEKLKAMKALFYQEAEKYHVYPLDDRGTGRLISPSRLREAPIPTEPVSPIMRVRLALLRLHRPTPRTNPTRSAR
jgi:arylsulfatase